MLQQTQTERVVPKYLEFLKRFPTWEALAKAPTSDVVKMWMGLGYYRRALNLHRAAQSVVNDFNGKPPSNAEGLRALPGVGPYTAAAVATFAYGEAVSMIETNIRTVYLYAFFPHKEEVSDKEVLECVEETMYRNDPRAWFYALMDLGVVLKKHTKGIHHRSKHHVKQSRFQGSQRQVRAAVLKLVSHGEEVRVVDVKKKLPFEAERVAKAIEALCAEGFISKGTRGTLRIA
jgi:A/G-specific adenine glycosylase